MTHQTAKIFIPALGSTLHHVIADASGIVGQPRDNRILIYYEGNVNGASNMASWQARLRNAAGRMLTHYPTVAMSSVEAIDLIEVGELVQYADKDHFYGTHIYRDHLEELIAYTGESALSLLSAPHSQQATFALGNLANDLKPYQKAVTDLVALSPAEDAISHEALWLGAIALLNAEIENRLPEIARATGNTEDCLREWFEPRHKTDTWFGPESKNQPADFLWNVACHQSMDSEAWLAPEVIKAVRSSPRR